MSTFHKSSSASASDAEEEEIMREVVKLIIIGVILWNIESAVYANDKSVNHS
jgi:hypothetical protein